MSEKALYRANEKRTRKAYRRHPAEVTIDRLGNAATEWHGKFDGRELDMIGLIIHALSEIACGER